MKRSTALVDTWMDSRQHHDLIVVREPRGGLLIVWSQARWVGRILLLGGPFQLLTLTGSLQPDESRKVREWLKANMAELEKL